MAKALKKPPPHLRRWDKKVWANPSDVFTVVPGWAPSAFTVYYWNISSVWQATSHSDCQKKSPVCIDSFQLFFWCKVLVNFWKDRQRVPFFGAPSFCQENDQVPDLYCLEVSNPLKFLKTSLGFRFLNLIWWTAKTEMITLPETNSLQIDSNWWLEEDPFPFGMAYFQRLRLFWGVFHDHLLLTISHFGLVRITSTPRGQSGGVSCVKTQFWEDKQKTMNFDTVRTRGLVILLYFTYDFLDCLWLFWMIIEVNV